MIETLEVRTNTGALLSLTLDDVTDGFLLTNIDGLDPGKATLVSSSFANLDGSDYQSSKRPERNITMRIALDPYDYATQTVRGLRHQLYQFFMPKTEIELTFNMSDAFVVKIMARVESFETSLFSKDPSVDISLICYDPDFMQIVPSIYDGDSVNDLTEFTINNAGSVNTGVLFTFLPDRSLSEFTIYHRPADGFTRTIDIQASLVSGDRVDISTVAGDKYVRLTRGGTVSSLLYAMTPQSDWIQLQPGSNALRVYALGLPIPFEFAWTPRYGGL